MTTQIKTKKSYATFPNGFYCFSYAKDENYYLSVVDASKENEAHLHLEELNTESQQIFYISLF